MIDHVTYQVEPGTLDNPDLIKFMNALGLQQTRATEDVPEGWSVKWFQSIYRSLLGTFEERVKIHLVEKGDGPWDELVLGHFAISSVGSARYAALRATPWCVRDSGSGRIWLEFVNLRVEVRP
jgi:hypothetical protein